MKTFQRLSYLIQFSPEMAVSEWVPCWQSCQSDGNVQYLPLQNCILYIVLYGVTFYTLWGTL